MQRRRAKVQCCFMRHLASGQTMDGRDDCLHVHEIIRPRSHRCSRRPGCCHQGETSGRPFVLGPYCTGAWTKLRDAQTLRPLPFIALLSCVRCATTDSRAELQLQTQSSGPLLPRGSRLILDSHSRPHLGLQSPPPLASHHDTVTRLPAARDIPNLCDLSLGCWPLLASPVKAIEQRPP
jgi:hypothetical protein